MSVFKKILDITRESRPALECYDRHGECIRRTDGVEFADAVARYRTAFTGWAYRNYQGHKCVALFFRPEETVEFLVATFAALAEGFTVVPFYPNWTAQMQEEYLRTYRLEAAAVGDGFRSRVEAWKQSGILDRVLPVSLDAMPPALPGKEDFPENIPGEHPCAWIFTSGTSGVVPKCTVISERNIAAAVANIQSLDFLRPGQSLHSPLSASHIFAFVVILGMLAARPRRLLFSDVQYLARLSQDKIGKIDGLILVPAVLNRLRSGFYEKLMARGEAGGRMPRPLRRILMRCVQTAENAVLGMDSGRLGGFLRWPAIGLTRLMFGRRVPERLGSPEFIVVGGAKPNLHAMAFLDALGIRCLQGWGMTETTGPLAVCNLRDRFRGAFGTCGGVFSETEAYIEDGELIVEGPQIAAGYVEPDGSFIPFNGLKRTGDYAEFDRGGRLRVLGKVSDRITLANGLNYNPIPLEESISALDLERENLIEEPVVIGDGQAKLGCVFFLRDLRSHRPQTEKYLAQILRDVNASRAVDEQIGPRAIHPEPLRESVFFGPSGKLRRPVVEKHYSSLFETRTTDFAAS